MQQPKTKEFKMWESCHIGRRNARLEDTGESTVVDKLKTGKGNLVKSVEDIKSLGAKAKKAP